MNKVDGGWRKKVTVAVVPGLPVDFFISCEDHLSLAGVVLGNTSLPVLTRSQKQNQSRELEQESGDGAAGKQPASDSLSRYFPQHPEPNLAHRSSATKHPDQNAPRSSTRGKHT